MVLAAAAGTRVTEIHGFVTAETFVIVVVIVMAVVVVEEDMEGEAVDSRHLVEGSSATVAATGRLTGGDHGTTAVAVAVAATGMGRRWTIATEEEGTMTLTAGGVGEAIRVMIHVAEVGRTETAVTVDTTVGTTARLTDLFRARVVVVAVAVVQQGMGMTLEWRCRWSLRIRWVRVLCTQ